jgi:hypothetical protein
MTKLINIHHIIEKEENFNFDDINIIIKDQSDNKKDVILLLIKDYDVINFKELKQIILKYYEDTDSLNTIKFVLDSLENAFKQAHKKRNSFLKKITPTVETYNITINSMLNNVTKELEFLKNPDLILSEKLKSIIIVVIPKYEKLFEKIQRYKSINFTYHNLKLEDVEKIDECNKEHYDLIIKYFNEFLNEFPNEFQKLIQRSFSLLSYHENLKTYRSEDFLQHEVIYSDKDF